jgi:hypothetical protein
MVASAPSSAGAPFAASCQPIPTNLSPPLVANRAHSSRWSSASTLMHIRPVERIIGQLDEVEAGQNDTYGGSRDTDVTDWQVNPIGRVPS